MARLCTLTFVALLAVAGQSCRSSSSTYRGTVVIGDGYVQVLATADGDSGCPPRTQHIGTCVRTPPLSAPDCERAPACVTRVRVSAPERATVESTSSFVEVPWLTSARPASIRIDVGGCGGDVAMDVAIGPAMSPFAKTSARVAKERVNLAWTPAAGADQVCALWRSPSAREVCCAPEGGTASFAAPADVTDVRLSRGVLVGEKHGLRIYKTSETGNLLAD